jgi:plasmid stabilization system protein ParE
MDYRVSVTATARWDVREIARFISPDSPQRGARFGLRLIACAGGLAHFPQRGRIVPEFEDPAIRGFVFRSYRVIYHLDDRRGIGTILRFWHGARGTPNIDL